MLPGNFILCAGDSESNYGNAKRLFIDALNFPDERIHPIIGDEDPDVESARYSKFLLDRLEVENGFPIFDWIWLGLGEDGHTASIFPNYPKPNHLIHDY